MTNKNTNPTPWRYYWAETPSMKRTQWEIVDAEGVVVLAWDGPNNDAEWAKAERIVRAVNKSEVGRL